MPGEFLNTIRNGWVRIDSIIWVGYDPDFGTATCVQVQGYSERVAVIGTLDAVMAACGFTKVVTTPAEDALLEQREGR